jgi:hypothetical protein
MHVVQDGSRNLKFEGKELAFSSSREKNKTRWIEFTLFRTEKGHYVLSRVGVSVVYHHGTCPTVKRNNLDPLPSETIPTFMIPCDDCLPDLESDELVYPETDRKWAQVSDSAEGVVSSLKQLDSRGTEYLTVVARVLLERAAEKDSDISDAFYTEWVS